MTGLACYSALLCLLRRSRKLGTPSFETESAHAARARQPCELVPATALPSSV